MKMSDFMNFIDPTPQQILLIEKQLGRPPRGIRAISCSHDNDVPLVVKMAPLVDKQPFPTLFWLCSKDLHKAISQIESEGWVKRLEKQIASDPVLCSAYQENHRSYIAARWRNCSHTERQLLHRLGFGGLFDHYGIGGLRDWNQVRCLHMHYAHHLCGQNVIGQWLDRKFDLHHLKITI